MTMNTDTYTNDAIRAISEINREDNSRDLAIVSQAKTTVSLRTLEVTARQLGLQVFFEELNCEDGQPRLRGYDRPRPYSRVRAWRHST